MTEKEKKAINNLWNSATDVMFNVLYSQEEMQEDIKVALNLIQRQQAENEKKDKIIDEMLQEFTNCEFELKCSGCCCECEKDYDQLYVCNKQYFENKVENT